VAYGDIVGEQSGETAPHIRARVEHAAAVQRDRFSRSAGVHANAQHEHSRPCGALPAEPPVEAMLRQAVTRLGLSAREYHRCSRLPGR